MKQAIKITEQLLSETTISKYSSAAECMAARNVLVKLLSRLNEQPAINNAEEYFKKQKGGVCERTL